MNDIQLFKSLKTKLGENEAEELVTFVKQEIMESLQHKTNQLASKEDLAKTESKILLWNFGFWVAQLAAMFALYKGLK